MLYLAQVKKKPSLEVAQLELLAYQKSDQSWGIFSPEFVSINQQVAFADGVLVLAEISENQEITEIREAKDWVVDLVSQYITYSNMTPEFLHQEETRLEEWRKELTLQNLELSDQRLELEIRRAELQELESTLRGKIADNN